MALRSRDNLSCWETSLRGLIFNHHKSETNTSFRLFPGKERRQIHAETDWVGDVRIFPRGRDQCQAKDTPTTTTNRSTQVYLQVEITMSVFIRRANFGRDLNRCHISIEPECLVTPVRVSPASSETPWPTPRFTNSGRAKSKARTAKADREKSSPAKKTRSVLRIREGR